MNKIEALRFELKCRELVEGTDLEWWKTVKFQGHIWAGPYGLEFTSPAEDYELALGIVEGKPLFVGDTYYNPSGCGVISNDSYRPQSYLDDCSWNPPKSKTVMVEMLREDAIKLEDIQAGCPPEWAIRVKEACRKALENKT